MLTHICTHRTPTRHSRELASTRTELTHTHRIRTRYVPTDSQTHRQKYWLDTRDVMGSGSRTVTVPLEALGQTQGQGRSAARAGRGNPSRAESPLSERPFFGFPCLRVPLHTPGSYRRSWLSPPSAEITLPAFLSNQTEPDS